MQLLTGKEAFLMFQTAVLLLCHVFWSQTRCVRVSAKCIDITVVEISMHADTTIESEVRLSWIHNHDPAEPVWLITYWCVLANSLIGLFLLRSHRNMTYRRRRSFVSGSRRWPACRSETAFRKALRMASYCASELVNINILGHVGKVSLLKYKKKKKTV